MRLAHTFNHLNIYGYEKFDIQSGCHSADENDFILEFLFSKMSNGRRC